MWKLSVFAVKLVFYEEAICKFAFLWRVGICSKQMVSHNKQNHSRLSKKQFIPRICCRCQDIAYIGAHALEKLVIHVYQVVGCLSVRKVSKEDIAWFPANNFVCIIRRCLMIQSRFMFSFHKTIYYVVNNLHREIRTTEERKIFLGKDLVQMCVNSSENKYQAELWGWCKHELSNELTRSY